MGRKTTLAAIAIGLVAATGCVERRFVVNSDPPGALVLSNGKPIGFAPGDNHFTYYGNYHFTLIKPGYATLQVDQKIPAPWYEWTPIDLISEILWPWHIEDVRQFTYRLEPVGTTTPDDIMTRGQTLRNRGQAIGAPAAAPAAPAVQAAPVAPPTAPPSVAVAPASR